MGCAVVTIIAVLLLPEAGRVEVAREFEEGAAMPVPRVATGPAAKVAVPSA
jgi:hypothetical protein